MSSSLVFTGVGLNEHALGISPVVYLHGEKSKNDGGVKVDVSARKRSAVFSCLEDEEEDGPGGRRRREVEAAVEESSESSSIGAASSSSSSKRDDEEDGDEAESRKEKGGFGSFDSLEESLPIKRGLSNFFSGKSKSFASLADVATASASDLAKRENPFNKRRRILMAFKARRASYGSLVSFSTSASSMSSTLLSIDQTVEEEGEGEDDDGDDGDDGGDKFSAPDPIFSSKNAKKITVMDEGRFRSPRSFSLSDLRKY